MGKLKIIIGPYQFTAKLHEEEAPETCKKVLEKLPLRGKTVQARWSGEACWFQMDAFGIEVPFENHTSHPSKGELLYYPGGMSEKEILIPYGSVCFASKMGQLAGNHFATIVEGVEMLSEMGLKVLWEGAQDIEIKEV